MAQLQYSCPKNPMDREAWWVMVHEITKSQTQQKRLSKPMCYKRSDILPYSQAKKLDCHSFLDAGRRRKTPGSETKDFILMAQQIAWTSTYLGQVLEPDSFRLLQKRTKVYVCTLGILSLGYLHLLWWTVYTPDLISRGKTLSLSPKDIRYNRHPYKGNPE